MRIKVNGTTLFFDVVGSKFVPDGATMRERPTLVLLHGGPGMDHSGFRPDFDQLADVAQLVYVDHRGNGRSDWSDPDSWNLDTWADDVRGLCDALEIERPIVLGWSFGGFVAQTYAVRHPDHPSKLVLKSTMARWDLDRTVEGFRAVGGEEAALAAKGFFSDPGGETMGPYMLRCLPKYSPHEFDPNELGRIVMNVDVMMRFFQGIDMDLTASLGAVQCPTLVVVGAVDPITAPACAEEIVAALPPGRAQLERFERSGHFIHQTEPEPFFAALRSFITTS
jgi:proline iminopeptidase